MTKARRERLREARLWWPEQNFTEDSHVVKAYRKRFNVDKNCAMKELCMLNVLSPRKQAAYERELRAKARKKAARRAEKQAKKAGNLGGWPDYQDDRFAFIVGYTSGGAPYGVTWEEMEE